MWVKTTFGRKIEISLGLLWLLDGLLQLQHQMFTSAFITKVITPASIGQPSIVSGPISLASHLFLLHPAIFNTLAAIAQLSIGLLILLRRTTTIGLVGSVFWGLIVWVVGEGYGGLLSGHTSLLMGAPGAAIIYVLLAISLLPGRWFEENPKAKVNYCLVFVWLIIWVGGGIYQLLPGQNTVNDVSSMVYSNSQNAPGWLARADDDLAGAAYKLGSPGGSKVSMGSMKMDNSEASSGYGFILALSVIEIAIGLGVLKGGLVRKIAITLGIILSIAFWIYGQSLGSYYSGVATDPSSGPLFILLGVSILGVSNLDLKLAKLGQRIKSILIGQGELQASP